MSLIKTLKHDKRVAAMEKFRGQEVEIEIDNAFEHTTYYGTVVAAGSFMSGTSADFIAIRGSGGMDFAWSGAVVRSIKSLES